MKTAIGRKVSLTLVALALFATIALMFWDVLRILISLIRR